MTAKVFAGDSVETFTLFEQKALAIADILRDHGVGFGIRVLLKADNSAAYVATLLALMHIGASVVLVDHQEKANATRRIFEQARVKLMLVDSDTPLAEDDDPIHLYELMVAAAGRIPMDPELDFAAWCEMPDSLIMWSSGSTGEPKGVVKNGGRMLTNLRRNAEHMGHRPSDVLLPLLPFNHQYGLSMVLIAWLVRCSLVIAGFRRLDRAVLMGGQCGATVLDATPATYASILNLARRSPAVADGMGAIRMFCCGAAPLFPSVSDAYRERFGKPLLDSYGSTELGNISFATIENPIGCGQVMDGLQVKIVDETGAQVAAGQTGEVFVNCPDMMTGYLDGQGDVSVAEQGWYATNDFGYLDNGGNVFIVGRKLAVHRNGYTLHPEVIEQRVAVAGCHTKVIAVPDETLGCRLVFFVEDTWSTDARHWHEIIHSVLPPHELPNRVHVIENFPLNRNGKPDRRALERLAAELLTRSQGVSHRL